MSAPDHEVVVIGGGFSGIGVAIGLQKAGIDDFLVIEEGDGVGGAWHWNTYPGVAVDIPSFSYQFSFDQRTSWSRVYAPGAELKAYAEDCVDKHGLRPRIRLSTSVTSATWDEESQLWRLETDGGHEVAARFVVTATGVLTKPQTPDVPGLDDFAGTTMHTARWDPSVSLAGKRVAIIGTGASALQIIPAIAPEVEQLVVFQRTPIWCMPKLDARIGRASRWLLRRVPITRVVARAVSQVLVEITFPLAAHFDKPLRIAATGERIARWHLRHQVQDPVLRAKLTPSYSMGCKRPSISNAYLRAFNRPNVILETDPIDAVTASGVRTRGGTEHAVDVLVLATGFKVFEPGNLPAFPIRGRGGADLERWWDEHRYQAYEGVSVPGYPNIFSILGPYAFNGSSYFTLIEGQTRHIVRLLERARARGAAVVEVTREANDRYFASVLARRHRQVFFRGNCAGANSYYFDRHGDVPFRPSPTLEVAWRSTHFDLDDYSFAGVMGDLPPA